MLAPEHPYLSLGWRHSCGVVGGGKPFSKFYMKQLSEIRADMESVSVGPRQAVNWINALSLPHFLQFIPNTSSVLFAPSANPCYLAEPAALFVPSLP